MYRKGLALLALPVFALSMAACSSPAKDVVEEKPQSEVTVVEEDVAQSGPQSDEVIVAEEDFIGEFDLKGKAEAFVEPSKDAESLGDLVPGVYPLVAEQGEWRAIVISTGDVVWTNSKDGTVTLIDEVEDVEVEESN